MNITVNLTDQEMTRWQVALMHASTGTASRAEKDTLAGIERALERAWGRAAAKWNRRDAK